MRPVRSIPDSEDNFRLEPMEGFPPNVLKTRRDPVEREPVGTILLQPSRITGYDTDCDGGLMARLLDVDSEGVDQGGEERKRCGIYPDTDLVVTPEELAALFRVGVPAADTGLLPCPSCVKPAAEPFLIDWACREWGGRDRWVVACSSCQFSVEHEDEAEAVARWNTRLGVPLDPNASKAPLPQVPSRTLVRFMVYLEEHPSWGSLHTVLDDENLEDHWVEECILYAEREGDREGAELGEILLLMDVGQRRLLAKVNPDDWRQK